MLVGLVLADDGLLRGPARWADRHESPGFMRLVPPAIRSLVALRDDETALAGDLAAEVWADRGSVPFVAKGLESLIVAFLASDRQAEAEEVLAWVRDDESTGDRPLRIALAHFGTAVVALDDGRDAEATDAAHALLDIAHEYGFVLYVIDALLLLAELASRRSDDVAAARLAGAATAARDRIGYRVPLLSHLIDIDGLAERLSTEQAAAFDEGAQLDLDDVAADPRFRANA